MSATHPLVAIWDTEAEVSSVSVSPDGKHIASCLRNNTIEIRDARTGAITVGPLRQHTDWVSSVAFSPDGMHIVSGSYDGTVRMWNSLHEDNALELFRIDGWIRSVDFSPDGRYVVAGADGGVVRVWDGAGHEDTAVRSFFGHQAVVFSTHFSPDGDRIVSGSKDRTIRIWDLYTGETVLGPLEKHARAVRSVAFSSDGTFIVSGSDDHSIIIWDAQSGALLVGPLVEHESWICSVAISPDCSRIVSGSTDRTIVLWDVRNGAVVASPLKGHTGQALSVTFSPDSLYVISGSGDSTIRLWDIKDDDKEASVTSIRKALDSNSCIDPAPSESRMQEKSGTITYSEKLDQAAVSSALSQSSSVQIVSSEMSALEMFHCLLEHGCADLSSYVNTYQYSSVATAGGSFGDIWRGRLNTGAEIAIKCLRFHVIAESYTKSLKRVMREIYVWSKARHNNVQELMGIIMFQGRLGMVSLWMEHGNLQEYLRRNPSVNRYRLCIDIAAGVSYLHGISMVHGDIKALNVLVSKEGVAKLSDFDHSILSNSTLEFSATTNVGGGTLRWMAPELLVRQEEEQEEDTNPPMMRTTETDIYALGMTMLETITGKMPYHEYKSDMGIYRAIDKKLTPIRPRSLTGSEQTDLMWALLTRCWDHEPSARPRAPVVSRLLQELSRGEPQSL